MRASSQVLSVSLVVIAACGGGTPEPAPAPEPEPTVGEELPPPEVIIDGVAWADMDRDQKAKYMLDVVQPTMQELFVAFDAETFGGDSFGCATCHGNNATEVDFAMPNTLHPLDPKALPTPASPDPKVARWATFMFTRVTPKMVELLGEEPYDMDTHQGFGCFGCHSKVD